MLKFNAQTLSDSELKRISGDFNKTGYAIGEAVGKFIKGAASIYKLFKQQQTSLFSFKNKKRLVYCYL